ncbi:hypothetical protein EFR24_05970, partial [Lactobacillus delbrueckii subsp. lactis]|nr:hypothetical protein [Lactobacillus delbrueckii subsp. lactis]
GSASPKESHFGRSFHTSSVMCFQTEACTCNRSLASVLLASPRTPTEHLKDLTSDQRADCFVFDDSLYSRTGYKKTELAAKVFDHVSMTYKKGFRMMTMGWTDGSSFVPIASSLLSSKNDPRSSSRPARVS